ARFGEASGHAQAGGGRCEAIVRNGFIQGLRHRGPPCPSRNIVPSGGRPGRGGSAAKPRWARPGLICFDESLSVSGVKVVAVRARGVESPRTVPSFIPPRAVSPTRTKFIGNDAGPRRSPLFRAATTPARRGNEKSSRRFLTYHAESPHAKTQLWERGARWISKPCMADLGSFILRRTRREAIEPRFSILLR